MFKGSRTKKLSELILAIVVCLAAVELAWADWQEQAKLAASDAAAGDVFGYSVDISGNTAIVGSGEWGGDLTGSAYLFDVSTGNELFKLTASDGVAGDEFGNVVAISGNIAIVGALHDDGNIGSAFLFDVTTGEQLAKLVASDRAAGDHFGGSVAISGYTAIVGAVDAGVHSGSAYLFDMSDPSNPVQTHKLNADDAAAWDFFGDSVATDGNLAIVGARGKEAAYLFDVATGTQLAKLVAFDPGGDDEFGNSVDISGNLAIVGAYRNGGVGSVYVFDASDPSDPVEICKLTPSDGAPEDYFGYRKLAISGSTVIVGAYGNDDAGDRSGSAYLFEKPATGWPPSMTETCKLTASDAATGDGFGISVGISGKTAIVGAYYDNNDAGTDSGSAYVFVQDWEPVVLVPGILGSWSSQLFNSNHPHDFVFRLPKPIGSPYYTNVELTGEWQLVDALGDPFRIYTGLIDALADNYHVVPVPYDWRLSNDIHDPDNSGEKFLLPAIDRALRETGAEKVNVIAHSMGGLMVRSYIQSDKYRGDIDKFIMLGTPNHGAVDAYHLWEGGEIDPYKIPFSRYLRQKLLRVMKNSQASSLTDQQFVVNYIPSVRQLLPTFPFLRHRRFLPPAPITSPGNTNDFLGNLNSNTEALRTEVETQNFIGTGQKTLESLWVRHPRKSRDGKWEDGRPMRRRAIFSWEGDGTVLSRSARLEEFGVEKPGVAHDELPKECINEILEFLGSAGTLGQVSAAGIIDCLFYPSSGLFLEITGPVSVLVTNPDGESVGYDYRTEELREEEESFLYLGKSSGQSKLIALLSPERGNYTVEVTSATGGDYRIRFDYVKFHNCINRTHQRTRTTFGSIGPDEVGTGRVRLPRMKRRIRIRRAPRP